MMKRQGVRILLVVLLISLFVTGCGKQQMPNAESDPVVKVTKAKKDTLVESLQVSGKLEPVASSDVVPSGQGGKVETVHVNAGDRVDKGQALVTLEHTLLSSAVRQAKHSIAQAKTGLELAKINYEKTKADYERGKTLYEQGAIPATVDNPMAGKGFEDYQLAYKTAEQKLENARTALESAKEGLVQVRERYEHAFIRAPISGLVTEVNLNPGEMASPASRAPVITVADLSRVIVQTNAAEDLVNNLSVGNEVEVIVPALTPQPFSGKITSIAPVADNTTKAFPVEVQLDNPDGLLKPGMLAEVMFKYEHPESIVVPVEAVVESGGDKAVWVVEDGVVVRRKVQLGAVNGKKIVVLAGVKEGEQVVTTGNGSLQNGQKIEINS